MPDNLVRPNFFSIRLARPAHQNEETFIQLKAEESLLLLQSVASNDTQIRRQKRNRVFETDSAPLAAREDHPTTLT